MRASRCRKGRSARSLTAAALFAAATAFGSPSLPGASDLARLASHGPWPPAFMADPRNPVSGHPEGVAFGERLFHAASLSTVEGLRCSTCHEPWRSFADGRTRSRGAEPGVRNTPTLLNVGGLARFGWDGANDSLWVQSIRPLLDPREMRASATHVAQQVRSDPELAALYAAAFAAPPPRDDEDVLVAVGKALAAFEETLQSPRTPFDEFRDAVLRGDATAAAAYPAAARRGLRLFDGRAGCAHCHAGPAFTDSALHRSLVETGRSGLFRTPGLREVASTGPYMHDGSIASLCDAVQPHAADTAIAPPPTLPLDDRRDLVAFLRSLSVLMDSPLIDPESLRCP